MTLPPNNTSTSNELRMVPKNVGQKALRLCGQLVFWDEGNVQHPPAGEADLRRAKFLCVNENRVNPRVIVQGHGSVEVPKGFLKPIARRYYLQHNFLPAYLFRDILPDMPPSFTRLL